MCSFSLHVHVSQAQSRNFLGRDAISQSSMFFLRWRLLTTFVWSAIFLWLGDGGCQSQSPHLITINQCLWIIIRYVSSMAMPITTIFLLGPYANASRNVDNRENFSAIPRYLNAYLAWKLLGYWRERVSYRQVEAALRGSLEKTISFAVRNIERNYLRGGDHKVRQQRKSVL